MEIKELDKEISSNKIRNIYFFYGEETFLLDSKVLSIKKKLIAPDFADFNVMSVDGKTGLSAFSDFINSYPFMSEKKLLIIKDSGLFSGNKGSEMQELKELCAFPPEYLHIIFVEKDFDKKKESTIKFIEDNGAIVRFDRLSPTQIENWLEKMFEKQEKRITPKALSNMVARTGGSLTAAYNEFQKLLAYVGERADITPEDVDNVVSKSVEFMVYELFDKIVESRNRTVMTELKLLCDKRDKKDTPQRVYSILLGAVSELLMVKQLKADGLSAEEISGYYERKVPLFVVNKAIKQSKKFEEDFLAEVFRKGTMYDLYTKSGKMDIETALQLFVTELLVTE